MRKVVGLLWVLVASSAVWAQSAKLVLNWKAEAEFGGFYEAEIGGHFAREKLKVEILSGGVGTPAVQMVAAGQADFGISSGDEIILSQDRGTDVIALFAVYQTNPQGLIVRAERGVKGISQILGGGILAAQKGLPYFQFLEKKYGPIRAKVVPMLGGISQLAEDPQVAQQCFVTSEPILAQKKGLQTKSFLIAETGFNPYTTVVIARRSLVENRPAFVDSFLRAVGAGWRAYLKNPAATNAHMHKLNPTMDMDTLEKSAKIQLPLIATEQTEKKGVGSMTAARWDELSAQLKSLNLIKEAKPAKSYFR